MGEAKRRRERGEGPRPMTPDWHLLMAFLGVWKSGVQLPDQKGHCMFATRVAAEILGGLGFHVEPVRVWIELTREDAPDVFVGLPSPWRLETKKLSGFGWSATTAGEFLGHIVLRVDEGPWLLDVALAQFTSPEDGLVLPPGIATGWFVPPERSTQRVAVSVTTSRAVNVLYWLPRPDLDAREAERQPWRPTWEQMLDGEESVPPEVIARLVSATRALAAREPRQADPTAQHVFVRGA